MAGNDPILQAIMASPAGQFALSGPAGGPTQGPLLFYDHVYEVSIHTGGDGITLVHINDLHVADVGAGAARLNASGIVNRAQMILADQLMSMIAHMRHLNPVACCITQLEDAQQLLAVQELDQQLNDNMQQVLDSIDAAYELPQEPVQADAHTLTAAMMLSVADAELMAGRGGKPEDEEGEECLAENVYETDNIVLNVTTWSRGIIRMVRVIGMESFHAPARLTASLHTVSIDMGALLRLQIRDYSTSDCREFVALMLALASKSMHKFRPSVACAVTVVYRVGQIQAMLLAR